MHLTLVLSALALCCGLSVGAVNKQIHRGGRAVHGKSFETRREHLGSLRKLLALNKPQSKVLNGPEHAGGELSASVFGAKKKLHDWVAYSRIVEGGSPPPQVPAIADALFILKGNKQPSDDFPKLLDIPEAAKEFDCSSVNQAGFYADPNYGCQVFHRCDINGRLSTSLCGVSLIFNQITLVCDWYYNVDCSQSSQFYDYSNARLYHKDWKLFDETAAADGEVTTDATEATTVITSTTESATSTTESATSATESATPTPVTDPTVSATSTLSSVATTASDAEVPTTTVV
ncbi:hypothetical protein BV898_18217 [Hypsibius exemplaris]|uniref:Chitin-binding type-2 domain-containing protein n=1 Tax=Hypsibius exemplaris TaxID=2072580 RepID=A0A9X6RNM2_HYPEX|nr:hypothetical protein BV898_18217 [Hypsibius exemplaris]